MVREFGKITPGSSYQICSKMQLGTFSESGDFMPDSVLIDTICCDIYGGSEGGEYLGW